MAREDVLIEDCIKFNEDNLFGIISKNGVLKSKDAVLILNAGIIHRIGPNRIYVKLARELSSKVLTLRFDFSSTGDSSMNEEEVDFHKKAVENTVKAMDFLKDNYEVNNFILIGLCSGGDIALKVALNDSRIKGICTVNSSLANKDELQSIYEKANLNTKIRYYKKNVWSFKRWKKLVCGKSKINLRSALVYLIQKLNSKNKKNKLAGNSLETTGSNIVSKSVMQLLNRNVKILNVYSEGSTTLDVYNLIIKPKIKKSFSSHNYSVKVFKNIDHVFTLNWSQQILINTIKDWLFNTRN